jgi:predicted transcriptional regulator
MKSIKVSEVMVPIEEYATVSENATMYDAVLALEKAQAEYDKSRYHHRALLVYNAQNKIVGKISQLDLLMALEPNYSKMMDVKALSRTGYSLEYIESLTRSSFWSKPLDDICRKSGAMEVKNFMNKPEDGEYIEAKVELNAAVHQLIIGKRQSLLVTRDQDIVGILRLTDVFKLVCDRIKACNI